MTDDVVYSYEAVESYVEGAGTGWCSIMLSGDGTSSFRVLKIMRQLTKISDREYVATYVDVYVSG